MTRNTIALRNISLRFHFHLHSNGATFKNYVLFFRIEPDSIFLRNFHKKSIYRLSYFNLLMQTLRNVRCVEKYFFKGLEEIEGDIIKCRQEVVRWRHYGQITYFSLTDRWYIFFCRIVEDNEANSTTPFYTWLYLKISKISQQHFPELQCEIHCTR